MDVRAGIDSQGNLVAIDFTNIIPQWGGTSGTWPSSALAGGSSGSTSNWVAFPPGAMYNLPNQRYTVNGAAR